MPSYPPRHVALLCFVFVFNEIPSHVVVFSPEYQPHVQILCVECQIELTPLLTTILWPPVGVQDKVPIFEPGTRRSSNLLLRTMWSCHLAGLLLP